MADLGPRWMPISTRRCPRERCIEGELMGSLNHHVVPATHSRPPAPPRKDQLSVGHAPKASSPHIILNCPSTYGKERQMIVKRFRGGGFGRGDVGLHIKSRDSRWERAAPRCVYFPSHGHLSIVIHLPGFRSTECERNRCVQHGSSSRVRLCVFF